MQEHGKAVLLIDDELIVLKSAKRILEKKGYTVFTAEDAEVGTALLKEHKPKIGVILLDLTMPGIDAEEAFDRIIEIDPSAKVLLFSGMIHNDQCDRLFAKGAVGYIHKPFDIDDLTQKLNHWIAR